MWRKAFDPPFSVDRGEHAARCVAERAARIMSGGMHAFSCKGEREREGTEAGSQEAQGQQGPSPSPPLH